jgi:SAM-dependent methyltransferase
MVSTLAQSDPVLYELFRGIRSVRSWDLDDGDAQLLKGIPDNTYDFVHSSHCLEHLHDPSDGLHNWLRVVKPGGHLIFTVPDEDLYEQGQFPSTFNVDHKWTFTIFKSLSWHDRSLNIFTLVPELGPQAQIIKIELLDSTFRYALLRFDQTLTPVGECGIEVVLRKRPPDEVRDRGRPKAEEIPRELGSI